MLLTVESPLQAIHCGFHISYSYHVSMPSSSCCDNDTGSRMEVRTDMHFSLLRCAPCCTHMKMSSMCWEGRFIFRDAGLGSHIKSLKITVALNAEKEGCKYEASLCYVE